MSFLKVALSFLSKKTLWLDLSSLSSRHTSIPVRYLIEKPLWFSFPIFICSHIYVYTPSGFLLFFLFKNLLTLTMHFTFLNHQYLVEILTNLILLIAVLYSIVWLYHLYIHLFTCWWAFISSSFALTNHTVLSFYIFLNIGAVISTKFF